MAEKPAVEKLIIGTPGPFQVIENRAGASAERSPEPPRRRYSCPNYPTCLDVAAALDWDNYTCRGCCGEIDESLFWRAHQARRKDSVVRRICNLPDLPYVNGSPGDEPPPLRVVGKL